LQRLAAITEMPPLVSERHNHRNNDRTLHQTALVKMKTGTSE
jgi:hypothetical protein